MDLLKGSRISEADEINVNLPTDFFKDSELTLYRGTKLTINQYTLALNSFRAF